MNKKTQDFPLNKYLAQAGIVSRRKAADLIKEGQITVNHFVVTDPAYKVQENDTVRYKKQVVKAEALVYILVNKPVGYLTSLSDPHHDKMITDLLKDAPKVRLHPIGRLDLETSGLLVMTNDGDLTQKLAHPKSSVPKIYHIMLDKPLEDKSLEKIRNGITLRDGRIKADRTYCIAGKTRKHIGMELHSGRKRIVRRIFHHLGYEVIRLDRVAYAGLTKKKLPRGEWRFLTELEIEKLRNKTPEKTPAIVTIKKSDN